MPKNNSWNSQDPAQVTKGGTGLNSCSQGDLLYGSAPNTLAILPKETTPKRYLSNSGPNNNPAYSAVDIQGGVTGVLPVTNGGTGVSSSSPAFGVLAAGTSTTNPFQNIGTGSLGEYLVSNGPGILPSFQIVGPPSGSLGQQVRAVKSGLQTCSTKMELFTTPTNTQGDEVLTVTITPTNVNSILVINAVVLATSGGGSMLCAIFQDSTVNALFATGLTQANGLFGTLNIQAYMTAGTTSPTTFKLRCGPSIISTNMYINGASGGVFFGGGTIPNTTLFVTEFLP